MTPSGSTVRAAGGYTDRLVNGPHSEEDTTWNSYVTSSTQGFAVLHTPVMHRP